MRIRERFNPRAPCGARLGYVVVGAVTWISTHAPLAGRDPSGSARRRSGAFQPTRPLRGATSLIPEVLRIAFYFNPRAPCGARLFVPNRLVWSH